MKDKKYNLADFFTMRCDLCDGEGAQFATFLDAKQHYRAAHEISGYLVCCGKRFQKPKTIDDHFRYHTDPDYLKYDFSYIELLFMNLNFYRFVFLHLIINI